MTNNIYIDKPNHYFSNVRYDLISFMEKELKSLTILEIGAGSGATLLELKQSGFAEKIYGYDIVDICKNKNEFEQFVVGNIEQEQFPFNEKFDIIILADVLEHLIEPEMVLKKIVPYLKDNGSIYISLPNIRYFKAVYQIFFKGNFKYEEEGVLDKTHLRFFCKKNMKQLINKTEAFNIVKIESNLLHTKSRKGLLNSLTFRLFEEFLSQQYFLNVKFNNTYKK